MTTIRNIALAILCAFALLPKLSAQQPMYGAPYAPYAAYPPPLTQANWSPSAPFVPPSGPPVASGPVVPEMNSGLGYGIKPLPHVRFGIDYVFLWHQRMTLPFPTLTSGFTADAIPGALGQPGTTPVFQVHESDPRLSAGRARLTFWMPHVESISLDMNAFQSAQGAQQSLVNSASKPTFAISRPIFNPGSDTLEALPISAPGLLNGTAIDTTRAQFYGAEINLRNTVSFRPTSEPGFSCTPLVGVRWLKVDERYSNNDQVTNLIDNNSSYFQDRFSTSNTFFGGQVGLGVGLQTDLLEFDFVGKLAMGMTQQSIDISGASTITDPLTGLVTTDLTRGTYAQPTNIGHYTRSAFTLVPELGVNARYSLSEHFRFSIGYTGLLIGNVVRPSGAIDLTVNPQAIQGGAGTAPNFPRAPTLEHQTMWIQMVQVGLECVY